MLVFTGGVGLAAFSGSLSCAQFDRSEIKGYGYLIWKPAIARGTDSSEVDSKVSCEEMLNITSDWCDAASSFKSQILKCCRNFCE